MALCRDVAQTPEDSGTLEHSYCVHCGICNHQQLCNGIMSLHCCCKTHCSVYDGLQSVKFTAWLASEGAVTVVQFINDETGHQHCQCSI